MDQTLANPLFGLGRFLVGYSFWKKTADTSVVQILRDSALFYQSLWLLFGLLLAPKKWVQWLTISLVGIGLAQYFWWLRYIYYGLVYGISTSGFFGFIHGNDSFSTFFPLTLAIWPIQWSTALAFAYGHAVLGLFLIYFKKSWFLCVFAVVMPMAIWMTRKIYPRIVLKKTLFFFGALLMGLTIASIGANRVSQHKSIFQDISKNAQNTNAWFFHGELDREESDNSTGSSYMAWRFFLWRNAIHGFLEHPFLGNGFGPKVVTAQQDGMLPITDGKWISGPHNSFLTVAFRGGVIGIASLLLLTFIPILVFFKKMVLRSYLHPQSYLALAALFTQIFAAFFNVTLENPQHGTVFWVLLGAFIRLTYTKAPS